MRDGPADHAREPILGRLLSPEAKETGLIVDGRLANLSEFGAVAHPVEGRIIVHSRVGTEVHLDCTPLQSERKLWFARESDHLAGDVHRLTIAHSERCFGCYHGELMNPRLPLAGKTCPQHRQPLE